MDNLSGRVCLVTGATNGIGEVTALELAKMGATVVIVGRNPQKTAQVVADIKAKSGNSNIDSIIADLSYGADVINVANTFKSRYNQLHVLVNNAGAVILTHETSKDGLEMTFALNHMSYFTLTNALLDLIIASGTPTQKARIVNVSSSLHARSPLDFNDLQTINPFSGYKAYCRSKLMNVMFTKELNKRLQSQNAPVIVNTLHPGVVKTGFARNNTKGIFGFMISLFMPILLFWRISPEQGAQTQLYLASSPEVEGVSGEYFDKSKVVPSSSASLVEADWTRLWTMSEQIDETRLKKG